MSILNDKTILITGGTGSFGKRFVKEILKNHKPKKLIIYSRDELKQFEMQEWAKDDCLSYVIGDVRDIQRLRRSFRGVDYVIHAAAMKQVPASETNPMEAINTNVMGAENIINACIDCGVKKIVALSTDKACNPANLYGATKLCSDKLFIAANGLVHDKTTSFAVVRYGNVIGSRGSVIPFFMKKKSEGVLPITDPRMTRFMITLTHGVQFVLDSLGSMQGGEIFIPKIPSMDLPDIKEAVAPECKTEVIGIRPGEKLHEAMISADDARTTFELNDRYVIYPQTAWFDTKEFKAKFECKEVPTDFTYDSAINPLKMSVEELRQVIKEENIEL
jgi:UDP-N-acetylglucosamine 4,6-dehydratase/5-epimerase